MAIVFVSPTHSAFSYFCGFTLLIIKMVEAFNLTSHYLSLHACKHAQREHAQGIWSNAIKYFVSALALFFLDGILSHNLQNVLMKYMKL